MLLEKTFPHCYRSLLIPYHGLLSTVFMSIIFIYLFLLRTMKYRGRPRNPPHMDVRLSQADTAHIDELDEEFDTFLTSKKQNDILKLRYDRLRAIASRV